mgnify:CR=1 FL=1
MRASILPIVLHVAAKELRDGVRHRAGYVTMGMFALTVIAFMSMSLAWGTMDVRLAAALFWIVLFFAATLQGERPLQHCFSFGSMFRHRPCSSARWQRISSHSSCLLSLPCLL